MIPALVASEIRETLLDYLRTTWALSDRELEAALFRFLSADRRDGGTGVFQGPYLRLRLPFEPAPSDARIPLDLLVPYTAVPTPARGVAAARLEGRPRAAADPGGDRDGIGEDRSVPVADPRPRSARSGARRERHQSRRPLSDERAGRRPGAPHRREGPRLGRRPPDAREAARRHVRRGRRQAPGDGPRSGDRRTEAAPRAAARSVAHELRVPPPTRSYHRDQGS